jgi:hypothetical protein
MSVRIAVAGTHRAGKTTLVEAFARAHPDFEIEREPYEQLQEEAGEEPLDDLSPESFERQLEYLRERVAAPRGGRSVVFDRSPLDFLAYLRAIDRLRLGASDWTLPAHALAAAEQALGGLDLVAFVRPRGHASPTGRPIRSLKRLVDHDLAALLLDDVLGLVDRAGVDVVELTGSTDTRLRQLSRHLAARTQAKAREEGRR